MIHRRWLRDCVRPVSWLLVTLFNRALVVAPQLSETVLQVYIHVFEGPVLLLVVDLFNYHLLGLHSLFGL